MFEKIPGKRKLRRKISRALSVLTAAALLAGTFPADLFGGASYVSAEEAVETETVIYDFRDGSIVPADSSASLTEEKSSSDGRLKIAAGETNSYRFNDASHGVEFHEGNTVTIHVLGDTELAIGGCVYSQEGTLTVTDQATQEEITRFDDTTTEDCSATLDVTYKGEETDLLLTFGGEKTYVPYVKVTGPKSASGSDPAGPEDPDPGAEEEVRVYTSVYDFRDGSIVPTNTQNGTDKLTSGDGKLTVECGPKNGYGYNGAEHGSVFKEGNFITLHVLGKTKVDIGGCEYSDGSLTVTSGGDTIKTFDSTRTTACYHNDETAVLSFTYEGGETDLVLTFGAGSTYVPVIKAERTEPKPVITYTSVYDFCDGSIVPTNTQNGTDKLTSGDGKLTVECGPKNGYGYNGAQHGSVFKEGNFITLHVLGKTKVDIGGCEFSNGSLTVTSGGDTIKTFDSTKTTACYHNDETAVLSFTYEGGETDLVLTFGEGSTYVPVIKAERTEFAPDVTEVKAKITLKDEKGLLQEGDTITLVNKGDPADVVDITSAGAEAKEFSLKVNAVYELKSSNSDIAAAAGDGKTTVATTTEDLEFEVNLTSTVVHPVVTFALGAGVTEELQYELSLEADAEKVVLENGKSVKLTIGKTYTLKCSTENVVAKISGGVLLTVTESLSAVTVDISLPDTSHHTYDVWDFGAEQLQGTDQITYRNHITKEVVEEWYTGLEPGAPLAPEGEDLKAGDLVLRSAGQKGKWRLRVQPASGLPGENESKLTDEYGEEYLGIMYSNATSSTDTEPMKMLLDVKAGDMVYAVVSSNGGKSAITWQSPSGRDKQTFVYTLGSRTKLQHTAIFTASEDGAYQLYSADEKLVVARIYRERPAQVTVSGAVRLPEGASWGQDSRLLFVNQMTGQVSQAQVSKDKANLNYSVKLFEQYTYDVVVENVEGCVVGENNTLTLKNEAGDTEFEVNCIAVDLVLVKGSLADLTAEAAAKLQISFRNEEKVYVPGITVDPENVTYSGKFERGVSYQITVSNINDFTLDDDTFQADEDGTKDIHFTKKPVYAVNVTLEGPSEEEAAEAKLTFTNINEKEYSYQFTGAEKAQIALRDGQYAVKAELKGYTQKLTSDVKVNGAPVEKTIVMIPDTTENKVEYAPQISVGAGGDYETINDALNAVRHMNRRNGQRVTIAIAPGDYEEMLVIDVPDVTLKNASGTPSIELKNKGVDIDANAVRVTSYYGHGYAYYSMGNDCKWNEDVLKVNKENGYYSYENPGSGTTNGSYWNATVVIGADGFQAEGIIFENSFNQYVSKKAAEDIIVPLSGAKEGDTPRSQMEAGDTKVQDKKYVERAAALAIKNDVKESSFSNCKFIGRQDTLYGGRNSTAAFYGCSVYGGTDYIFGPMIAVFAKCDLVLNTMEDANDIAYITAAQQSSGRGYLMYNCEVKSTVPGVDTASEKVSKPGYFGRPWEANTSEVVFFYTVVGTASDNTSLIAPAGWNNSLNGTSNNVSEYKTYEKTEGIDNSSLREKWAHVLGEPVLPDGTAITVSAFLGKWNPFAGKDMTIVLPDGTRIEEPVQNPPAVSEEGLHVELRDPGEEYVYTGSAVKPAILVTNNGVELTEGTDYTVKYSGNVKASTTKNKAKITVTGKGNLTGSASTTFEILPKDINDEDVEEGTITVVKNTKPAPVLVYNNMKLGSKDYTVKDNRKFTEDGQITVTGKGNYTGERTLDVTVKTTKKEVKKFTVTLQNVKLTYNGEEQKIPFTVKDSASKEVLTEGEDYLVLYPENVTDAGSRKFTVVGTGDYTGSVTKSYTIRPLAAAAGSMTAEGVDEEGYEYVRTGVTVGEDLVVRCTADGAAAELTEGRDYKISYTNNRKAGTAKYTVVFQGNYKGTKALTGSFRILPATLEEAQVSSADKVYSGKKGTYVSKPVVTIGDVALGSGDYTVKYYKDAAMEQEITGKNKLELGAEENEATVYVKVSGKGNYAKEGSVATGEYRVVRRSSAQYDLSKARVTVLDAQGKKTTKVEYTGEKLEPAVKVEYKIKGKYETVGEENYSVEYVNNVNKGRASIILTAEGEQYVGGKTVTFNIVAKNVRKVTDLFTDLFADLP